MCPIKKIFGGSYSISLYTSDIYYIVGEGEEFLQLVKKFMLVTLALLVSLIVLVASCWVISSAGVQVLGRVVLAVGRQTAGGSSWWSVCPQKSMVDGL